MQKALCNVTAEGPDHTHICTSQYGHIGKVHICRCGAFFVSVSKAELEKSEIKKVQ